jgi:outer membrane protein assembly factor BamB
VTLADGLAVVGRADGSVVAHDAGAPRPADPCWTTDPVDGASVVAARLFAGGVAVGERGPEGAVRLHDADTGALCWRHETAAEVGPPAKDTRFFLPFVAALAADGDRLYAAARRYDRDGDGRSFESAVYAFAPDGRVVWRHRADASPIALAARDGRVAVAYNRCPGDHQHGLVVLDAADGTPRWMWDPGTEGQRRAGDVTLLDDGVAVASHGDYRGYRLGPGGRERWRVDLARPRDRDGETVHAYPNHVHATERGVVFVTGNTYPEEGRETGALHPNEHTAFGYTLAGERVWAASVGGFASGLGTAGDRLAVPGAQHFRRRDPDTHGCSVFDVADGPDRAFDTEGVVAAAALADDRLAAVEEPVTYHDEGVERGAYRLHLV